MPYKNNYLTLVIVRLDFVPLSALYSEKPQPFSETIKDKFPNAKAQQLASVTLMGGPAFGASFDQQRKGWQWIHSDADDKRVVSLTPEYFAIEYKGSYSNFAEFRNTLHGVYEKFRAAYAPQEYLRIGLRYINEFMISEPGDAMKWDGILSHGLASGVVPEFAKALRMTRSMHQITGLKDDIGCVINYGLHNPDFPGPVVRRVFVLDLDAYVVGATAEGDALKKIDALYSVCKEMFEASIDDGLRNLLGK